MQVPYSCIARGVLPETILYKTTGPNIDGGPLARRSVAPVIELKQNGMNINSDSNGQSKHVLHSSSEKKQAPKNKFKGLVNSRTVQNEISIKWKVAIDVDHAESN